VLKALQIKVCALQAEHNKEMVSGLEKAGLKADSGAGVFIKYFLRGGGYYIDVGHSGIIASRQVTFSKVKEMKKSSRTACSSSMARSWQQARWYSYMRAQTYASFGDEAADQVGDICRFNEEGEIRAMWHRTGYPGFWFRMIILPCVDTIRNSWWCRSRD
jgi:hypothetical protein